MKQILRWQKTAQYDEMGFTVKSGGVEGLLLCAVFVGVLALKVYVALSFLQTSYHRFTLDVRGPDQNFYATWAAQIADGHFFWSKVPAHAPLPIAPLYSVLTALSFKIPIGNNPFVGILLFQCALSAAMIFVFYSAAKRLWGKTEAWIAVGLGSLYAPAYFMDACILRESLIAALGFTACALLLPLLSDPTPSTQILRPKNGLRMTSPCHPEERSDLCHPEERSDEGSKLNSSKLHSASDSSSPAAPQNDTYGQRLTAYGYCAAGLTLGFLHALRPTPLFWATPLFFAAVAAHSKEWAWVRKGVLVFVLALVPVLPTAIYHAAVTHSATLVSKQGADALILGNDPTGPGIGLVPTTLSTQLKQESNDELWKALKLIAGQAKSQPSAFLSLYARKLRMLLNDYETPSNYSFYVFKRLVPVTRYLPVSFGWLIALTPIGLLALFLKGRCRRDALWVFYCFGTLLFGALTVAVQERYRYSVIPFLILFAAGGLGFLLSFRGNLVKLVGAASLVAVIWFWSRPLPSYGYHQIQTQKGLILNPNLIREVDYVTWVVALWAYERNQQSTAILDLAREAYSAYGKDFEAQYKDAIARLTQTPDAWAPNRFTQ